MSQTAQKEFSPGVYPDIPNAAYHAANGISSTAVKHMCKSPAHYKAHTEQEFAETDALRQGKIIHTAVLEPEKFEQEYTVIPANAPNRPTERQRNAKNPSVSSLQAMRWWDEFAAENAGKTIIKPGEKDLARRCRDAVHAHKSARDYIQSPGRAEQSCWAEDPETGLILKCRPDWWTNDMWLVDLKTAEDASPVKFESAACKYGYHLQAPFYMDVAALACDVSVEGFVFVVVEKTPPYAVEVRIYDNESTECGRQEYRAALRRIIECQRAGYWPAYTYDQSVRSMGLPGWKKRELECQI